jgi:hypothetical protein
METVPADAWSVDRVHSTIGFSVEYTPGTFTDTFSDFDVSVADGVRTLRARIEETQTCE